MTSRHTNRSDTFATNLVRQPIKVDQIVTKRPHRLLNVTEPRAQPKMFCKTAKRPLIASLLAVIGTVYPKTRINQPAIGKDSVQRAKSLGSQRQLNALLQP